MTKHFFTFRKIINGQPAPIYIEVIIAESISRKEARGIAEREIAELRQGVRALRKELARAEKAVTCIPDYRFIGAN